MKSNISRNRVILIVSLVLTALLAVGVVVGVLLLKGGKSERQEQLYSIIVDDEITVYSGEDFTLVPYVVNKDGTVEESRFDFKSSSEAVTVNQEGVISVKAEPDDEVYITIAEANFTLSTKVHVNVIQSLSQVLGITLSDSDGHKTLVSGTQNMEIGDTYTIEVTTKPQNVNLKSYCSVKAVNSNGEEKQVFNFSFDKTNVSLSAVGLGSGELQIVITDANDKTLYQDKFNFSISMNDAQLGNEILDNQNSALLSKTELEAIQIVTLDDGVSSLSELEYLTSLKTVVFNSENVMEVTDISDNYIYRFKTLLFDEYRQSLIWSDYFENLYPYEQSTDEVYVIYHDDKTSIGGELTVTYEKVDENYVLSANSYTGYRDSTWQLSSGEQATQDIIRQVSTDGLHVYAVWVPIEYTVTYVVRDDRQTTEEWNYETNKQLKNLSEFSEKHHAGYKFIGWTTDSNSGSEYGTAQFSMDEAYGQLTATDKAVITLYDVWAPIEYTIHFDLQSDAEQIADVILFYNQDYQIPSGIWYGYTFNYWSDADNTEYYAGSQITKLTEEDGKVITFKPDWTENHYILKFSCDLSEGTPVGYDFSTYAKELSFTEPFNLSQIKFNYATGSGNTAHSWFLDLNNNGTQETAEGEKSFSETETVSKLIDSGEVTLCALFGSGTYKAEFIFNGVNSLKNSYEYNYKQIVVLPGAADSKSGYTMTGWKAEYNGRTYLYSLGQSISGSGLYETIGAVVDCTVTFTAIWQAHSYTVNFNSNGGSTVIPNKIVCTYDTSYTAPSAPAKTGNTFMYWSYGTQTISAGGSFKNLSSTNGAELTITAVWSVNSYSITRLNGSQGGHVDLQFLSGVSDDKAKFGATVEFSIDTSGHATAIDSITCNDVNVSYTSLGNNKYSFVMPAGDVDITVKCTTDHSCFAKGTLILLADGETIEVENLSMNDMILAFDHSSGYFVESKIIYIYKEYDYVKSIDLYFSENVYIELLNVGHGMYDVTLNKYVLINADNVQDFIGHNFLYAEYNGDTFNAITVTLNSYSISQKLIERYDLITEETINHFANGLLVCSDVMVGISNMFDFNDDYTYDLVQMQADIENYGLFNYEDWCEYLTYEDFVAFNSAYYKIAVEKGCLTYEEIFALLEFLNVSRSQ